MWTKINCFRRHHRSYLILTYLLTAYKLKKCIWASHPMNYILYTAYRRSTTKKILYYWSYPPSLVRNMGFWAFAIPCVFMKSISPRINCSYSYLLFIWHKHTLSVSKLRTIISFITFLVQNNSAKQKHTSFVKVIFQALAPLVIKNILPIQWW